MPQSVIDHISDRDRKILFLDWISREPSETGWIIVSATVKELGEEFIEYVFRVTYESLLEDGVPTREELISNVTTLFTSFATDLNIFAQFVDNFLDEDLDNDQKEEKTLPQRDEKGRFIKKQK